MGEFIFHVWTINIDEIVSSYGEPFEEKFISELEQLMGLPIHFEKTGYFDWYNNKEKKMLMRGEKYIENYSMTLNRNIEDPITFYVNKEYRYFDLANDGLPTFNLYLLFSALHYLTRKVLSLGGKEMRMLDMSDTTSVIIQEEADIDNFFELLSYGAIIKETIQYRKVPYAVAQLMPSFPKEWK